MVVKNLEKKENGKLGFQVEIDAAAFEKAVNGAYLKAKKSIYVPGFRKGKAPRMVIEGMYGTDVFYEDAIEELAPAAFDAGIAESDARTVGHPAIVNFNVDETKTLTIDFEIALYPEVKLGEYKGIEAYKAPVEVSEEEIAAEIENLAKQYELEVEKVKSMVPNAEIEENLKTRKAVKVIVDNAVAVAPKAE